ncbi:MAG TPA: molybdenum cofactor biosynthesis protein MoaE [Puia sp.]|uniref:molybdenum cofactor biosynthesis protein MoaE n=1 Tax=Puia sp. TaxID=2045100 RepID=UPI002C1BFE84|nr:molybdenum cofactor biosynthesis protein MoaE [Puia sp.]HVU96678.1 molybdenum cofactor biosynthesis protein MoaE [Puia sp.]
MTPSSSSLPAAADRSAAPPALSDQPLDIPGLLSLAHHPGAGAVVLFSGEVRDSNRGQAVAFLEYEAHIPMAASMIAEILATAKERWSLHTAIAQHRVGRVDIGDTAVVVITASAHRSEAYTANKYIIDRIKHEAPIWKCEHYADGTKEWGNNCNCHAVTGDIHKHIYE